MKNPNRGATEDVLRRLREGSYERMRVELLVSVELLMKDFKMTWDDTGRLLKVIDDPRRSRTRADIIKDKIVQGQVTLRDLNTLAHLFSCEPYIIFRPRLPWIKS